MTSKLTPEQRLAVLGHQLNGTLVDQIRQREPIERRWIEDIRQYYGRTDDFASKITDDKDTGGTGKKGGFNRTRSKVNTGAGRLGDLLFPGNDKNWGIGPSPVPEIVSRLGDETPAEYQGQTFVDEQGRKITEGDVAARQMDIAKTRARSMELEIEDQLNACSYGAEARLALFDAAKLGTGIIKGPIVEGRMRKAWVRGPNGQHQLVVLNDRKPAARRVTPWDFVPDMAATTIKSADFAFERVYTTRDRLPGLASKWGFNQAALERVLAAKPGSLAVSVTQSMNEMRAMSGMQPASTDNRYEIWLYNGFIDTEHLLSIGAALPEDNDDALQASYPGMVWMCGNEIIKAAVSPLDTGDLPYSLFVWEPDEACIFGFSIPFLTRNSQTNIDNATESLVENGRLSSGGQIVVRKGVCSPENGKYEITPNKVWVDNSKVGEAKDAFYTYEFQNHQAQISAMINHLSQMMDEESLIPVLAQGEQGIASDTLGGMAMLMNAALTTVRQQVKRWDDDVTVPNITRFYDWNMLNNKKDSIKGDFEVSATGTSTLLAREIIGRQLFEVLRDFGSHPILANWTKIENLYKQFIATTHIKPEEAVRSEEEYGAYMKRLQEQQQAQGGEGDWRMAKIELDRMRLQFDAEKSVREEQMMIYRLRLEAKISEQEFNTRLAELDKNLNADLYKFQTEAKIKLDTGQGF